MSQELLEAVVRLGTDVADLKEKVAIIEDKERRVRQTLEDVVRRMELVLNTFDRDRYKGTDQRLLITDLAREILIFDRLRYDLGNRGSQFLLGVAALLEGRNQHALDAFGQYLRGVGPADRNGCAACYLGGMATYNRGEFLRSMEFFQAAFDRSPEGARDWQSLVYVAELAYFLRKPAADIEWLFRQAEEGFAGDANSSKQAMQRATLWLKLGNCYVETFLPPKTPNPMRNNRIAVQYYKKARKCCPAGVPAESLLPAVIDYSLAQALLLHDEVDMDLSQTPSELLADVFRRLKKIVLTKREEIILAQCYMMLGTIAFYSSHVPKEIGEIYFEYARHQTLVVPSDVCFYSCVTKELVSRDEFVGQIDFYTGQLDQQVGRR